MQLVPETFWVLTPSRTRIHNRQPDNGTAIFAEQNIVVHFDGLSGVLRLAKAHVEHVRFLVIIDPNMPCRQAEHVRRHGLAGSQEIMSRGCYRRRHAIVPFGLVSNKYDVITKPSVRDTSR